MELVTLGSGELLNLSLDGLASSQDTRKDVSDVTYHVLKAISCSRGTSNTQVMASRANFRVEAGENTC